MKQTKAKAEAEAQTQGEINNQGDTQSTNETEIIIDLPIPYTPDMMIEKHYSN